MLVLQYRKLLFNGTFYNGFQIEQTNRSHRLPNHLEPRLPTPLPTYQVHQPVLLHPLQSGAMVVVVAHDIAPSDSAFFGQLPLGHRGAPSLLTSCCFLLSVAALSPPYSTASSSRRAVHSASFPLPPPTATFPRVGDILHRGSCSRRGKRASQWPSSHCRWQQPEERVLSGARTRAATTAAAAGE